MDLLLNLNQANLIPIVSNVLKGILELTREIRFKVKQVSINKKQCLTLSKRIERVVKHLQIEEFVKKIRSYSDPLLMTLESFHEFLRQCSQVIKSFMDGGRLKKFILSSEHKEQFAELNSQLKFFCSELSMSLIIQQIINKQQDEQDRLEDNKEIQLILIDQIQKFRDQMDEMVHLQQDGFQRLENRIDPGGQVKGAKVDKTTTKDGTWLHRYFQYGLWHGPFKHHMKFNFNNDTFEGYGTDNIGEFILSGGFSKEFNQIDIIQTYKYGTGNPQFNTGHQCRFRLVWNQVRQLFEGVLLVPNGWTTVPAGLFEMSPHRVA